MFLFSYCSINNIYIYSLTKKQQQQQNVSWKKQRGRQKIEMIQIKHFRLASVDR